MRRRCNARANPGQLQILTLIAAGAAVLAWIYAPAKRLVQHMNPGLASALIAGGAIVVTIGVLAFGAAQIAERQREYERTLNPLPEFVNAVLPDATSLQRGEALYLQRCLAWQGASADFRALRNRLPTVGDDFIFHATLEGWRELPPCAGELDVAQRWDIVNYIRTFEKRRANRPCRMHSEAKTFSEEKRRSNRHRH